MKPVIVEKCDGGSWSLEIRFGRGDWSRDVMRATSDFLRGFFKVEQAAQEPQDAK